MQVGKIIGAVLGARDILKLPNPEIHKILKDLRDEVQNRRSPAPFPPPNSSWEKIRKQNTEQTATVSSSLPTEDAVIISNPPEKMKNLEPNPQKSKKYNQYGDEIE
ncbi:hypothetical protein HMI55_000680 [Coelomomyces lativittatus]|nr:hypothetical protein HMI55_000680 [Coelomomyces lativittatus]